MPQSITTEGIVLKKKVLPNQDHLYSLITMELGKVVIFAKGIKNIRSKRLPHLQTGNLVKVLLHKSNNAYYMNETTIISAFSSIKSDEVKLQQLYLFLFCIDRLLPELEKELPVYTLTKSFLISLAKTTDSHQTVELYLNKMLVKLGYIHESISLSQIKHLVQELTNEKLPVSTV